jgi:hypothetical protein
VQEIKIKRCKIYPGNGGDHYSSLTLSENLWPQPS